MESSLTLDQWLPETKYLLGYDGSLTFPPCTPVAKRYIYKEPLLVTPEFINEDFFYFE